MAWFKPGGGDCACFGCGPCFGFEGFEVAADNPECDRCAELSETLLFGDCSTAGLRNLGCTTTGTCSGTDLTYDLTIDLELPVRQLVSTKPCGHLRGYGFTGGTFTPKTFFVEILYYVYGLVDNAPTDLFQGMDEYIAYFEKTTTGSSYSELRGAIPLISHARTNSFKKNDVLPGEAWDSVSGPLFTAPCLDATLTCELF